MRKKIFLLFFILAFVVSFQTNSFTWTLEKVKADLKENIEKGSVLGIGVMYPQRPYKGMDNDFYAVPIAVLEYKRFFIDGAVFGFHLIDKDALKFSVAASPRFGGYESDDSPDLNGMQDRDGSFDAGLRAQIGNKFLTFTVTGLTDLLGRHDGGEISATFSAKLLEELIKPRIGLRWLSNNLTDYYYGVQDSEVTASRPAYKADSTVNYIAGITIGVPLGKHWALVSDVQYELLGDEIEDSPIVDEDGLFRYVLGLVYRF